MDEKETLKEIKFDIKILITIRQTVEDHLPWFTNSLESEPGIKPEIEKKIANTIARIIECTFVMQIVNMIGNFNFYQCTALTESSNSFFAESLIVKGNIISKGKKSLIKFVEPMSEDIIKIPRGLFDDCFNLMRIPFYLFTAIYRKDKGAARKLIRNVIKEYEKKVKDAEILAISFLPPRQKLIYEIKKIIDSFDPLDLSKSEIARRYGLPRQTFFDRLGKQGIEIADVSWTLKDSNTGENL